jgi:hypothetical protein
LVIAIVRADRSQTFICETASLAMTSLFFVANHGDWAEQLARLGGLIWGSAWLLTGIAAASWAVDVLGVLIALLVWAGGVAWEGEAYSAVMDFALFVMVPLVARMVCRFGGRLFG